MEKYFDYFDYLTAKDIKALRHSIAHDETPLIVNGKTFNGRAFVRWEMDIETGEAVLILRSYYTDVCGLRFNNGKWEIERYWELYSPTTQKHINAFVSKYSDMKGFSKKEWLEMPMHHMPYRKH